MHQGLTGWLAAVATSIIVKTGYTGVFLWMALSAIIPVPSEIVLAFGGKQIGEAHQFNLHVMALIGTLGNLFGSIIAYGIGYYGGRPFVEKYGKYLLIKRHDIEVADGWFARHGDAIVFWTRMLPLIRAFVSVPAGIARMNFGKFCIYTLLGGWIWCYLLVYAGIKLGEHWDKISHILHAADAVIVVILVALIALWVYRHTRPEPVSAVADSTETV